MKVWPGYSYPLGATWDGTGVNFALFSEFATSVELVLFNSEGKETDCVKMVDNTDQVFHLYLPDIRPGQLYGFRVYGPTILNDLILTSLIDPYAEGLPGCNLG